MKQIATLFFLFIALNSSAQSNNWQSLFDGKTLNGWKQMTGSAPYKVENGSIVGTSVLNSPNSFLVCDKKFTGDFVLEMEVMLNNANINSGIQFKSNFDPKGNKDKGMINGYQYELDPSDRKWTAGIYDESGRGWLYPVSYNQDQRQLLAINVFHKVRIECIGNTVKTWLDGKAASYLVDEQMANEGLIALQVHNISKKEEEGYKIAWKNIRIQTKNIKPLAFPKGIYVANKTSNNLTDYEKESGWKLLFDGKTNNGWVGAHKDAFPQKGWNIKDGILTVLPSDGDESTNGGDIITKDEYSAFELSWDFKLTKGANSGVKYFVTLKEQVQGKSAIGLEFQLLDDALHPDAKLGRDGNRTLGSLYDLITAKKTEGKYALPGNWNTGRIIVYPNNHVEHYLNGLKVLEYDRGSQAFRDLVAISKYKVWPNFGEAPKGHILLQDHGNEVEYKNIKIKELK